MIGTLCIAIGRVVESVGTWVYRTWPVQWVVFEYRCMSDEQREGAFIVTLFVILIALGCLLVTS